MDYLVGKFEVYCDDVFKEDKWFKNELLVFGIELIKFGELENYWMDVDENFFKVLEMFWWEVWVEDFGVGDVEVEF